MTTAGPSKIIAPEICPGPLPGSMSPIVVVPGSSVVVLAVVVAFVVVVVAEVAAGRGTYGPIMIPKVNVQHMFLSSILFSIKIPWFVYET